MSDYSLVHCASIFGNTKVLNVLLKSGCRLLPSYHFTPLNTILMLYYRKYLKTIIHIKRNETSKTTITTSKEKINEPRAGPTYCITNSCIDINV